MAERRCPKCAALIPDPSGEDDPLVRCPNPACGERLTMSPPGDMGAAGPSPLEPDDMVYLRKPGDDALVIGPIAFARVRSMAAQGKLIPCDEISRDRSQWQPLDSVGISVRPAATPGRKPRVATADDTPRRRVGYGVQDLTMRDFGGLGWRKFGLFLFGILLTFLAVFLAFVGSALLFLPLGKVLRDSDDLQAKVLVGVACGIAILLYVGWLQVGLKRAMLEIVRERRPRIRELFRGANRVPGYIGVWIAYYGLLAVLGVIFPAGVAFLLFDFVLQLPPMTLGELVTHPPLPVILAWTVQVLVLLFVWLGLFLTYGLAFDVIVDCRVSIAEAFRTSRRLMAGNEGIVFGVQFLNTFGMTLGNAILGGTATWLVIPGFYHLNATVYAVLEKRQAELEELGETPRAAKGTSFGMAFALVILLLSVPLVVYCAARLREERPSGPAAAEQTQTKETALPERVRDAAFSRDGKFVVTAGGKTARLWDAASGNQVRQFEGHSDSIMSVEFSPDDRHVLTASEDKTVRLWEVDTASEIRRLRYHDPLRWAEFSPDGRLVLAVEHYGRHRLRDTATGDDFPPLKKGDSKSGPSLWGFSPDGWLVATGGPGDVARFWDAASGKEVLSFEGRGSCRGAFSPDGRKVLTGSRDLKARLWDVKTGKQSINFDFGSPVTFVAFFPDGRRLLTASYESVRLWDAESGKEHCRFRCADSVSCVAFSADSRTLITGGENGAVQVWDGATGKESRHFKCRNQVRSLSLAHDGQWLLARVDGLSKAEACLWDLKTGGRVQRFAGEQPP